MLREKVFLLSDGAVRKLRRLALHRGMTESQAIEIALADLEMEDF